MKKRVLSVLLILLALSACTQQPTQPQTVTTTQPLSGWQQIDGQTVYLDAGIRRTGWQDIDGRHCYFDESGYLQTGWTEIDGKNYYFSPDGNMATGFLELEEGTYYLNENGNPLTGAVTMDGENYLFNEDGRAYTGFLEAEGEMYYYFPNGMMAKGEVVLEDRSWFFSSQGKNVLIVNYHSPIPETNDPTLTSWRNIKLETTTMDAVKAMILDGEAINHKFWLNSAYRTVADQERIWNNRDNKYISEGMTHDEAVKKVSSSVARPGTSEHHTGLAIDIDGTWASLGWMEENSWRYGLIVRFPEGKTEFTGVIYEPWHFRYVGKELAKELYDLDMCLEEYMIMLTKQQGR